MRFGATVVLASALLVSLASQAQAQGQRGFGGGRGGFGGFGGGGAAGLIAMEAVQKEIGVSTEQVEKIQTAIRELGGGRGPGGGDRPNFQEMSEEERTKFFEEMRKQGEERAKKAEEILKANLDAKQLARLEELRIQREGAGALARTEVAAKLKLTDDQKEKIKEALASAQVDLRGGGGGGFDREAMQKRFEEARAKREKANADALAVLTADQKTAFDGLQGAKFEFPAFGGRGGPGGQGGGRPGRPPAGND
ncbi:hypothetical protein [Planctellipticum variicoloris]|uniref:hypothetical protein n=1 Tax=Planctellipticum variicoloris TaxID=3064265 RepID=UPI003013D502|nr:hypothetical protein SH412_004807 [Planctomycetaceae bacterium SH412]